MLDLLTNLGLRATFVEELLQFLGRLDFDSFVEDCRYDRKLIRCSNLGVGFRPGKGLIDGTLQSLCKQFSHIELKLRQDIPQVNCSLLVDTDLRR